MAMTLDARAIEALLVGGAVLGGGGGGSLPDGRAWAEAALRRGRPRLVSVDELPPHTTIATVSAVGAPAAPERHTTPGDFVRAVRILASHLDALPGGLIASENGGAASANGLIQSAALGIPVVDAPCNGRAHPTGVMGSMGLNRVRGFVSRQAAAGGRAASGRHVELFVAAPLGRADTIVRDAAVQAGGMIAVARNPVPLAYVREHGAPGGLALALRIGERVRAVRERGGRTVAGAVVALLGGDVLDTGDVSDLWLETRGGYDVGRCRVASCDLTFWNEFMTLERSGRRIATFPDLVATIDEATGLPVTTADLRTGLPVTVVAIPRAALPLGAGVRDPDNLRAIEHALNIPILEFTC